MQPGKQCQANEATAAQLADSVIPRKMANTRKVGKQKIWSERMCGVCMDVNRGKKNVCGSRTKALAGVALMKLQYDAVAAFGTRPKLCVPFDFSTRAATVSVSGMDFIFLCMLHIIWGYVLCIGEYFMQEWHALPSENRVRFILQRCNTMKHNELYRLRKHNTRFLCLGINFVSRRVKDIVR